MKKDNYEKRKKRISIIFTVGIAIIMVASIFAIVIDNQSQGLPQYNKHSFVLTNANELTGTNGYKTKINGTFQEFYYYPSDLERINLSSNIITTIKNGQGIGFIFNPEENLTDNLQYIDVIRYELQSQIDKPVYFGITQNSSKYDLPVATKYSLPIVDCDSATAQFPLILINTSLDTSFIESTNNPNCIIMNAKLRELLAAKDRLVYSYYDIMK
jgi:hypothetical protein